jgi:hypothetical protein
LFPEAQRPERGVDPPPSSTEVKERVELFLYPRSVPSWQVIETQAINYTYIVIYHKLRRHYAQLAEGIMADL